MELIIKAAEYVQTTTSDTKNSCSNRDRKLNGYDHIQKNVSHVNTEEGRKEGKEKEEEENDSNLDDEEFHSDSGTDFHYSGRKCTRSLSMSEEGEDTKGGTTMKRAQSMDQHNQNERKRRKHLKHSVNMLRDQLRRKTRRPATICVLKAAHDEIKKLKNEEEEQEKILEELKQNNIVLNYLLEKLSKDFKKQTEDDTVMASPVSGISSDGTSTELSHNALCKAKPQSSEEQPTSLGPGNQYWYWNPLTHLPAVSPQSPTTYYTPSPSPSPSPFLTYPYFGSPTISPPAALCSPTSIIPTYPFPFWSSSPLKSQFFYTSYPPVIFPTKLHENSQYVSSSHVTPLANATSQFSTVRTVEKTDAIKFQTKNGAHKKERKSSSRICKGVVIQSPEGITVLNGEYSNLTTPIEKNGVNIARGVAKQSLLHCIKNGEKTDKHIDVIDKDMNCHSSEVSRASVITDARRINRQTIKT